MIRCSLWRASYTPALSFSALSLYGPQVESHCGVAQGFFVFIATTGGFHPTMEQIPSWEANRFSDSQEIPRIYGTRRFTTALTNVCHLSPSWARSIQSMPPHPEHPSQYYPHVYAWVSQVVSFLQVSSPKPCIHTSFSPIRATCPTLLIVEFITRTILGEEYRSLSSSLCSFLHSPVTSSLLGPNILVSTLFSNTLNLRSSLNAWDQVSHPYKTRGKITVLYILIFKFSYSELEDKRFRTDW